MHSFEIVAKLRCYATQSDKTGLYISRCPALGIVSQGRTKDEARESLDDSVKMTLKYCFEHGSFDDLLESRGFRAVPDGNNAPGTDGEQDIISVRPLTAEDVWDVEVPFHMIQATQRASRSCPA